MGRNLIFFVALGVLALFLLWMNTPTPIEALNQDEQIHLASGSIQKTPPPAAVVRKVESVPTTNITARVIPKNHRMPASIPVYQPESRDLKDLTLASLRSNWKIWNYTTAIEPKIAENSPSLQEIGKINGMSLVKTDSDMTLENFSIEKPVVLFNERLGTPGVVTGTLSFNLKNNGELSYVMNDYALKMVQSFSHMNLYYVTSSSLYFDLKKLYSSLSQDQRLQNVTLEILNKNYEKK